MGLEFWDIFAHVDRLPLLFSHYSFYPFLFFFDSPLCLLRVGSSIHTV
jgi:hypothetical protein